jgi:hypothetical protein
MKPLTLEDLALYPSLSRAVSNVGTYNDHLTAMAELNALLRKRVKEAAHVATPAPRKKERVAHVGSFVTYWDAKRGHRTAHVLEIQAEGRLKIRVHGGTATRDYDVEDVPFSEKLTEKHWSYR